MTRRSKIAKIVPIVNPSWLPFRVCSNDHAQLTGMPYIFFFKIKNCLNDDLFISCDDRIGKMLHNICISAVAMSLRWATRGPWASCWSNHHESCSICLSCWFLGQVRNWVTWGQKLGHLARSAENLVNTLAVTFLKQSSWILLKMFVLMIYRLSSKLGHLELKTRSPG